MAAIGDPSLPLSAAARRVGRYAIYGEIAQGGMATVHFGRLRGAAGFSRMVAIKRLHSQFAKNPDFVGMFTDEARLAARVRHPNVVPTLDVVAEGEELFLVMDYVHGETLSRLIVHSRRAERRIPPAIACSILCGALHGLHAAHEAVSAQGEPLHIVHRDVSPQNILVGADGIARVLDFGIAKAAGRLQQTEAGIVKGKVGYMSPEQLYGERLDRRTDTYAAGVVLWEALVCHRLFAGDGDEAAIGKMLSAPVDPPSRRIPGLPAALDDVVMRAVDRDRERRFATAQEMALALERAMPLATPSEVSAWVLASAGEAIEARAQLIAALERQAEESEGTGASAYGAVVDEASDAKTRVAAAAGGSVGNPLMAIAANPDPTAIRAPASATTPVPTLVSAPSSAPTSVTATVPVTASVPVSAPATLSEPGGPTAPAGRKVIPLAMAAGAVLFLGGALAARSLIPSPAAPSGAASITESAPAPLPAAQASSAPAQVIEPAGTADPPAALETAKAANTAAANTTAANAPPKAPQRPAKPPSTSCNPPYTIDANGHKRYKRECLR